MESWKDRLYQSYISNGQVAGSIYTKFSIQNYPYNARLIKNHVPANRNIVIADLGCGHGSLLLCLQTFGYKNLHGVDISTEQISLGHRLGLKELVCADLNVFLDKTDQLFDVIFIMDVLDHLEKPDVLELLDKVYSKLSKNGKVIIHLPNGSGLFGMHIRYGDMTHEGCFTSTSIRQALLACKFSDVTSLEDSPIVHGTISFIRWVIWKLFTLFPRMILAAETGVIRHILTQNFLTIAYKK